jgi:uncharacterized RDD family membrane protein YckC
MALNTQFAASTTLVPVEARATAGIRFASQLLNGLLSVVTLGIGWLIWAMVTWSNDSANPAQKILGLQVVKKDTGERLTWGQMFVRNFLLGGIVMGIIYACSLSVCFFIDIFKPFGGERQRLLDSMAGTVVVRVQK